MAEAQARWDKAIQQARDLLNYDREPNVAKLARKYLTVSDTVRWRAHGGGGETRNGLMPLTPFGFSPVEVLEAMYRLVGYQILDDGDPGVGYMYYGRDGLTACGPDHLWEDIYNLGDEGEEPEPEVDAEPYFHRCVEVLRRTYPDAKALTFERALEVLEYHEKRNDEYNKTCIEDGDATPEEMAPSPEELLLAQLVEELTRGKADD